MPTPCIKASDYLAFRRSDFERRGVGLPRAFEDAMLRTEVALNCTTVLCEPDEDGDHGHVLVFYDAEAVPHRLRPRPRVRAFIASVFIHPDRA